MVNLSLPATELWECADVRQKGDGRHSEIHSWVLAAYAGKQAVGQSVFGIRPANTPEAV